MSALSAAPAQQHEDEYVRYREEVIRYLARSFPRLPEPEEVYQQAWTELLELESNEPIRDVLTVLRLIAWRRARDGQRDACVVPTSPHLLPLLAGAELELPSDEQAEVRLDAAIARQIVNGLDGRQQAVLKLRFEADMNSREIQAALGISAKRLEKIVTQAYRRIDAQLVPDATGETPFHRQQRSLLLACLMGQASKRQLARAQQMVDQDPACRAMLRQLHYSLEGIAAVAPAPILVDRRHDRIMAIFDRLGQIWHNVRETFTNLVSRGDVHVTSEQAAGGAATIGAAGAAKVVLTCLAVAGGTAVCVNTLGGTNKAPPQPPPRQVSHKRLVATAPSPPKPSNVGREPKITFVATVAPTVTHHHAKKKAKTHATKPAKLKLPVSETKPAPEPLPAPPKSTEFLPGTIGSSGASEKPAAAPIGNKDGTSEFLP